MLWFLALIFILQHPKTPKSVKICNLIHKKIKLKVLDWFLYKQRQQWQKINMFILHSDNIHAWGTCVPLLINWMEQEYNFGDLRPEEKNIWIKIWIYVKWLSNCWVSTFGYKHLGWLRYFDFISNWPLKTVNKTGYHDGVKTTPKWYIELELIGLKPFKLDFFIFSAENQHFPVVWMTLNIYLPSELIGFLCLLMSFPMEMKVDSEFNAKCELACIPMYCITTGGDYITLMWCVYYNHTATKALCPWHGCENHSNEILARL